MAVGSSSTIPRAIVLLWEQLNCRAVRTALRIDDTRHIDSDSLTQLWIVCVISENSGLLVKLFGKKIYV
jgi:hypothetical protein